MKPIYLTCIAAALTLGACEEDIDPREPSVPDAVDNSAVRFADYSTTHQLEVDDEALVIKLVRRKTDAAEDVEIVSRVTNEGIRVPDVAHFGVGDTCTDITIAVGDIGMFTDYNVDIDLALLPSQADHYSADAQPSQLSLSISRVDYRPVGIYVMDSPLFGDELLFYHSEARGHYQVRNYLSDGYLFELQALESDRSKLRVKGQDAGKHIVWHTGIMMGDEEIIAHYPKTYDGSEYYNAAVDEDGITMIGVEYYLGSELISEATDDVYWYVGEE